MSEKVKTAKFRKNLIQDWVDAILWAFVVAMIIRNYTFQNYRIPTSSMEPTLLVGDFLVGNNMKYFFSDPERGDIVTFKNPDDPIEPEPRDRFVKIVSPIYWSKDKSFFVWYEKKNVVKRVIGMPGDTVEIRDKSVYINGEQYLHGNEQFLDPRTYPRNAVFRNIPIGLRDNLGPVTVPEGQYFVMGDNRDNSHDSRAWGFLDRNDITGTPALIFFSIGESWYDIRWERAFTFIK